MHIKKIISGFSIIALSVVAISSLHAGDIQKKNHEVIVIKKQADDGSMTNLEFDSDVSGVFLNKLSDGESKSITTKDGKIVTINRMGDELHVLANGETIVMPYMHEAGEGKVRILKMGDGDQEEMDIDMDIHMPEGLTISSSRELDNATQETIVAALANAGIQDEVHFSNGQRVHKAIFLSDDGKITELLDNTEGAETQEFTTEDGKHIKIIKRYIEIKD